MPTRIIAALIVLFGSMAQAAGLPRSTPEAQGVESPRLLALVEALDKIGAIHSVMLVRHGHVVAEGWWAPYRADARHSLYSLSKSFTSTAVGLAAAEGKLSVNDPVLKFFPEDAPAEPSNNLKAMRVSDLLRMSTGQQTEPARTPDGAWTKTFLAQPVPFRPGTHFLYNTSGTYMQSAIVQKVTGQTVLEYLRTRLFDPLGIENPTWETSPQGISTGGYGLSVRTEDIAKFGQLYLQRGQWNGKQIVPAEWIDAATARQTSNGSNPDSDWEQGYGYQFWRCRHGVYRGDGAFGQFCVVLPEQDAVVAITSGVKDMPAVLSLVWEHFLPAIQTGELAANGEVQSKLAQKLQQLSLEPPVAANAPSKAPQQIFGKVFTFPENAQKFESISLQRENDDAPVTIVAKIAGQEHRIACGQGKWQDGRAAWGLLPEQPIAAAGGWADDAFVAKICLYETPFTVTARFKVDDDDLTFNSETNVGFGPTKLRELVGKSK